MPVETTLKMDAEQEPTENAAASNDVVPPVAAETCADTSDLVETEVESGEPCPTPMTARRVTDEFLANSCEWTVQRSSYSLSGRTWGTGKPVYFLSAAGTTSDLFALVVWLLHEECRCVIFDYPGIVGKDHQSAALTASDLSADLLAVADHHGDEQFCLFATAFGGIAALTAMLECPNRIERAMLHTGFAYRRLSVLEKLLIRMGSFLPGTLGRLPLWNAIQCQNHLPWFPPFDRNRWEILVDNSGSIPIAGFTRLASVIRTFDVRGRLGEISQPVLLLECEGDGAVWVESLQELQQGLPNARVETLHNCGQLPHLTHPHRLTKLIRSFLLDHAEQAVC